MFMIKSFRDFSFKKKIFLQRAQSLTTITITYASAYILTALLELEVLKDGLDEFLGAWSGGGSQPTAQGLELGDL